MKPWRLATFNIESLDIETGRPAEFAHRKAALQPLLEKLKADILCLQEVNAQRIPGEKARRFLALDALLEDTPYEGFFRATSVQPGIGRPADVHNLAILSRWPIKQQSQIFHDHVGQIAIDHILSPTVTDGLALQSFDRPILTATIECPDGRSLHVMNLHLRAPRAVPIGPPGRRGPLSSRDWANGFYLAALKRQGQALEARMAVEALFDSDPEALIAICGDLNADWFETPTKLLRAAPEDSDGRLSLARTLSALEMRVEAQHRYSVLHDGRPLLLDHILASPVLARECTGVTIMNSGLADEFLSEEMADTSFHAPLVAEFDAPRSV